jgi:hypothetical protein
MKSVLGSAIPDRVIGLLECEEQRLVEHRSRIWRCQRATASREAAAPVPAGLRCTVAGP